MAEDLALALVMKIRERQPRIGARKLLLMIRPELPSGVQLGRDAFFGLLRRRGLLVRKRKTRAYTTDSSHWLRKYPNLVANTAPDCPNRVWVSDITYVRTRAGFAYLSLVTDAYSRKIVGWSLSGTLDAQHTLKALCMAISQLPADAAGVIHHSDRGVQYCCASYVRCLQRHGIRISMTERGDPYENAVAERLNGILKGEWLYDMPLNDLAEATAAVRKVVGIYNAERPHQSVEMLTPNQAHTMRNPLRRRWKSYRKKQLRKETLET